MITRQKTQSEEEIKANIKESFQKRITEKTGETLDWLFENFSRRELGEILLSAVADRPIMTIGANKDAELYHLLKAMGVSIVENFDIAKEENRLIKGVYRTIVLPD